MGYLKIILVGLIWLASIITSLKCWYKVIVLIIAILIPPFRIKYKDYINNIWVSDDQDIYSLLGGKNVDITISDRIGRECIAMEAIGYKNTEWHQAERVVNLLFFWQPNHCRGAIENDESI